MGSRQAGKDEAAPNGYQGQPNHQRVASLSGSRQRKVSVSQVDDLTAEERAVFATAESLSPANGSSSRSGTPPVKPVPSFNQQLKSRPKTDQMTSAKRTGSSHLSPPVESQRRGRSADPGTGRHQGSLSPANEQAHKRRSSETHLPKTRGSSQSPAVINGPDRRGTPQPRANSAIEERKNLKRYDLQRVVTAAAGMLKENKNNGLTAAKMITDALLWDGINNLSRSDPDIILAKEHLIRCLFAYGDFSRAEELSREVVAVRKATKPRDAVLVRGAQQKLVHTLLEIAMQHKNENNSKDATRVNNEALELALRNMDTQGNIKVGDDASDVLHFCDELLENETNPPRERTRLLNIKIRALQKAGSDQSVEDLREITLERLRLSGIYVLELKNKRRGNEVYSNVQSSIEAFRAAAPYEKDAACAVEDEARDAWQQYLKRFARAARAKWAKCLAEVRSQVRRDLPRKRQIRQKWYLLSRRLLARKRWKTVLLRIRRRARRFIIERRNKTIAKWCNLTQQLLERQKMEKKLLEERKERKRVEDLKRKEEEKARKEAEQLRLKVKQIIEMEETKRLREQIQKIRDEEKALLAKRKADEEEQRRKEEEERDVQRQKYEQEEKRRLKEKRRKEEERAMLKKQKAIAEERRRKEDEERAKLEKIKADEEERKRKEAEERAQLEKQKADEEQRRRKEDEERKAQQQKQDEEEKKRSATMMKSMNQVNTFIQQGVSRAGTGFSEVSETDSELGPVLFDARPTSESANNSEGWIKRFEKFRDKILPEEFNEETMDRIRLTIIDTGVDETHPYINERWRRHRKDTDISLFKDFEGASEAAVDEDGHGTFIVGLVMRLAPDVEVSVARVCRNQASMNHDRDRARKIAEAISYAIETWKTDIISMSIGYEFDMTGQIRAAVSNVLQTNRIIMLCAAGNFGNTRANISLPARMDGVFKIFACDHKGNASTMNPQPPSSNRDYGFSILGCEIESTWPMKLREVGEKTGLKIVEKPKPGGLWTTMSGTSFATPIAAALVAITYQFHDENAVRMDFQPGVEMKRPETVKAVLLRMSLLPGINGYNTLMPTVGRQNHFKFQPGRGKPMLSFFADKLSDITWDDL